MSAPQQNATAQNWFTEQHARSGSSFGLRIKERLHAEQTPYQSIEIYDTTDWGKLMKAQGGLLAYDDLAAHKGEWVEPVSTNYRGYDVWELPPNGQGLAALQMLNILEGYDFSKIPFGSTEHVHLFVEAKKLAFEDRAKFYADPDFAKAPIDWLVSKEYAAERRKLISQDHAMKAVEPGTHKLDGDTIYMSRCSLTCDSSVDVRSPLV